ncbi:MAG: DNA-directed RNA polymerase subunit beta' [Anaplasmataceae bacterium]|nr:DNA-directed RNA polymerase subunit beta' [Anaplasmataceae bacterium]
MSLQVKEVKNFGKVTPGVLQPHLNEVQLNSYDIFLKQGLKDLLAEISPIKDHTGKELELYFEDYHFDEPKYDEATSRVKEATYEASLRLKLRLENKKTGQSTIQEVYMGDFPIMTKKGTFIINGVERVVISQLIRSAGVYFIANVWHGKSLFGAKVIPNRGAWLEFETDPDGVIGVKIDRHRKAPVTDLWRVLAQKDEVPESLFRDVDNGKIKYLEATLNKDAAKNIAESYLEIYHRLRPGDPATIETAKSLVDSYFKRFDRYDLSHVGRFKLNQRLGFTGKKKGDERLLDVDDLTAIIREIIRLNNDSRAEADDIDHLGNRRLRTVGELLESRLRIGLARLRRIVQDRMSTLERDSLMPSQLVNFRPLSAAVKEFFSSSQLSQFMDQVNPLAEVEHKRRLSALGPGGLTRERAGFEVRDVHRSHYGRICPIQTPEGANIGLINYLSGYARVNELGFLETPYLKVNKGVVTKEVVWMNALEEEKYRIAHGSTPREANGKISVEKVEARIKGEPGLCAANEVDYVDVVPGQFVSVATSLIPFLQHDDANRALMGSNMQRQAVPSIRPNAPYVGTGMEEKVAQDSGYVVRAEADGEVLEADASHLKVRYKNDKTETYILQKFERSNQFSCISQRLLVAPGTKVKKGDVLADGPSTDNGVLALGQNLLVAFMPWEGANFEDAIIISERVVRDDLFTSIHIEDFYCDVRDTKLGPEVTTPDIPNASEEKLRNLDEEGVIRIGAEVKAGDILVGKISPKGESELTSEERLLRAIFGEKASDVKDTSLTLPHGKRGRVIGVKVFSRDQGDKLEPGIIKRIQVEIAGLMKVQAGDKLAGRHGNKGVISQVRPVEDMPYLADGTPVDIVLNPLGVVSRMNLGQVLETHLGWAASKLGYRVVVPVLDPIPHDTIQNELTKAGLPASGKTTLHDGRTGKPFENDVTVGQIYMLKLNHLVEDKIHMRSIGPYSLITQQPLGGKAQFGGQRFGEMEVWALEGYGARHMLQEMLTIKSDDVLGRSAAYEAIIRGEQMRPSNVPASFNVLVNELKALSFNIESVEEQVNPSGPKRLQALKISVASPDDIMNWSHGEVLKPETINYRTQRPEKDGLFSERIFGPTKDYECYCGKYRRLRYKGVVCDKCGVEVTRSVVRRERLGHIALAAPVSHIWFLKTVPSRMSLLLDVPSGRLDRVVYYIDFIITDLSEENRKRALEEVDRELKSRVASLEKGDTKVREDLSDSADRTKALLEGLRIGTVLSENEYFTLARRFGDVFKAGSGAEAIRNIFEKMDLQAETDKVEAQLAKSKKPLQDVKTLRRLKMLKSMIKNKVRPEWMILNVLPVLPPDLRPMVALDGGRYATSDLNDLYRRVINRNNRLKKLLEIKAPEVIVRNEKRMLQEAVDALIDNSIRFGTQQLSAQRRPLRSLADMLKGKQGRFRQNLLGKRVDYSGRSVIVVGPKLPLNACGIPKRMALELFRPFVISQVIQKGLAHNIRNANRLIEQGPDEVWEILEDIIKDRRVLLNRAPTLHRLSVQAFKPFLVEGSAIQIPPLVCAAFNADFDGDQMAVHVPLFNHAQREAEELMDARHNLLKPATGDLITMPSQDAVLGIYYMTTIKESEGQKKSFASFEQAQIAYEQGDLNLREIIILPNEERKLTETTLGRTMLNRVFAGTGIVVNDVLTKKKLAKLVEEVFDRCGAEKTFEVLDAVKLLGFEIGMLSGTTWSMADLVIPSNKEEVLREADEKIGEVLSQYNQGLLTDHERRAKTVTIWEETRKKLAEYVSKGMPAHNPIYRIIDSGSRGSWSQPIQMMGMKGLVMNPKGDIIELPIKASLKEGFNVLEYFIATHGARKGTTDTALKTAQAGYLTRRLVDVAQDVVVREENCKTKEGIEIYRVDGEDLGYSFADRAFSRVPVEDIKIGNKILARGGEVIGKEASKAIGDAEKIDVITVRSPITCKTLYGVCATCYGLNLADNLPVKQGAAVGIIAAQSIGEPGTQLTMRTFHTGGVAGMDITHGLPRIEELFEARSPKGKAILSSVEGVVENIEVHGSVKIVSVKEIAGKPSKVRKSSKTKLVEFKMPARAILYVKVGDSVEVGQQLSEGHLDLKELLSLKGHSEVIRYLAREVHKIYLAEGASIHNKHIEVIVRQMFSRVRVKDAGDALDLVMGEIVERSKFLEINRDLKKKGLRLAQAEQLLLGVTRVALSTESFLSAASFQDTSRALVKAAVEGRVDQLRGLKENVIIGRLIPAGNTEEDSVFESEMISEEVENNKDEIAKEVRDEMIEASKEGAEAEIGEISEEVGGDEEELSSDEVSSSGENEE